MTTLKTTSLLRRTAWIAACFSSVLVAVAAATPETDATANSPRLLRIVPDRMESGARNEANGDIPISSLQAALDTARPGDIIRLAPGVYQGPLIFRRGGTYGHPVVIEGPEDGSAIIDARSPFEPDWQPLPEIGPNVYVTSVPFVVRHVVADGRIVALLDERRVQSSLADSNAPVWKELFNKGIQNRWEGVRALVMYRQKTRDLIIRFGDNRDPRTMRFDLSPAGAAIRIENANRCVIRNLTLRNAHTGVSITDSLGSVVEHCRIGRIRDGIVLARNSDRCTLRFNTITQNTLGVNHGENRLAADGYFNDPQWKLAWDLWIAHKHYGFYDSRGILIDRTLGGHHVHDNFIHDHWDGISTRGWDSWKASAAQRLEWAHYNPNLDIHHNRIERTNDDALEPNDGGINQRWHHNFIQHARCGLRLKPIDRGPAFFYANQFKDNTEDIRCYGEVELNPAEVYVYHNTGTARRAINSNKVFGIGTPNFHFFNNLFWTENWWGNLRSDPPNWIGGHNTYVRRGSVAAWDEQKQQAMASGIDRNSHWIDHPLAPQASPFTNAGQGDFRLTATSPARGAGADAIALGNLLSPHTTVPERLLPGLDEFSATTSAPLVIDAGAIPYGAPLPQIPRSPANVTVTPAGFWPAP